MLSVGRSRDDGGEGVMRLGLGKLRGGAVAVGGEMEENELEEGEAHSGHDNIDPDTTLSYIDEKIKNVLGHFQKDFEGGFFPENLGAKYGGYGSFLPVHQRSPSILSQSRSPQKTSNHNTSRSPYSPTEGAPQKIGTTTIASVSLKNNSTSIAQPLDLSIKKDTCGSTSHAQELRPQCDFIKPANCNGKKPFKLRVKVGPVNKSVRNNAALYSGLGLVSPTSSREENVDDDQDSSPLCHDAPEESPMEIFEFYSCFFRSPTYGSSLLSPVPESLLQPMENKKEQLQDCKTNISLFSHGTLTVPSGEILTKRNVKRSSKTSKSSKKNSKPSGVKKVNTANDGNVNSVIPGKDIDIEAPESRKLVSNALNMPLLYGSRSVDEDAECQLSREAVKGPAVSWSTSSKVVEKDKNQSVDSVKRELESMASCDTNKFSNGRTMPSKIKTKLNLKPLIVEKSLEDRKGNIIKDDAVSGTQKDVKGTEFNVFKGKKDHFVGLIESVKSKAPQRALSCEQDGEKTQKRKEKSSIGKRKPKGGQTNGVASVGFLNECPIEGSVTRKEQKDMHSKDDLSESKSKLLKSQKDHNMILNREQLPNNTRFAKREKAHGNVGSYDFFPREKQKDIQLEYNRDDSMIAEKIREKPGRQNLENFPATEPFDRVSNYNFPPPTPSNLIDDVWVQCDKCHKWRLLPYGTNVNGLPGEWICSMMKWLPGMNKCHFTEEETVKAFRECYQLPISDGLIGTNSNHDVADPSLTITDSKHLHQNHDAIQLSFSGVTKKKSKIKDVPIAPSQSSLFPVTNSLRENQDIPTQSRYQENQEYKEKQQHKISEQYSDEGYLFDKNCKAKSNSRREFIQDGPKTSKKQKLQESHDSDVGRKPETNIVNGLSSKALGKTSQRCKDSSSSKDSKFDHKEKVPALRKKSKAVVHIAENGEVKVPTAEKSDNAKKRKVKEWQESGSKCPVNDLEETSETEMRKAKKLRVYRSDKREFSEDKSHAQVEKNSQSTRILISCSRDQLDGIGDSKAYNDKDRQLRQRIADGIDSSKRDLGCGQPSTAATSSSSKVSGSRKSKANFQDARDSPVESISSSPFRISNMGGQRRFYDGEAYGRSDPFVGKQNGEFTCATQNGFLVSNRVAEFSVLNSLGKSCDMQVREANLYATKDKDLLLSKIFGRTDDERSPSENEETVRGVVATNPTNISDQQNNCENDLQGQGQGHGLKHDNHYHTNGSKSPNSKNFFGKSSSSWSRDTHTDSKREKGKMKASKEFSDQDDLHPTKNDKHMYEGETDCHVRSTCYEDLQSNNLEKKERKNKLVKLGGSCSSEVQRDNYSNSRLQENMKIFGSSSMANKNGNSKVREISRNGGKLHFQDKLIPSREEEKSPNIFVADQMDKTEITAGKVKLGNLTLYTEKHDSKIQAPQAAAPMPSKGIKAEIMSVKTEKSNRDIILKEQWKIGNGANHNSMRNLTSNRIDGPGSVRKGGQSSEDVYKEARSLKHSAENLKITGVEENESTVLHFQSALKFLHAAFLMEHSERPRSIQLYSDTAKFCGYCAHLYEKQKEMAVAALAYKCMEVAYMKVVYSNNSGASKDRDELQNTTQIGESPSSSASDVDNLNTLSMINKAVSVKGVDSPQIVGNLVIAGRNRPSFKRLLGFAEDVNSAMDASKKALNAFSSFSLKNSGAEAMLSVKSVLDFSFHDIEGLLRLVRLSMELISG